MPSNNNISNKFDNLLSDYQHIIDVEKTADDLLLEEYRISVVDLDRLYIESPPARPRQLTIPEMFRRSYDQNFISDKLAYILDPNWRFINNWH